MQRIIQRFEDEYPECRVTAATSETTIDKDADVELDRSTAMGPDLAVMSDSGSESIDQSEDMAESGALRASFNASNTSLASKALADEEGRMHRYSQSVSREIALGKDDAGNSNSDNSINRHHQNESSPDFPVDNIVTPSSRADTTITDLLSSPSTNSTAANNKSQQFSDLPTKTSHLEAVEHRLISMSGEEMAQLVRRCRSDGVEKALMDTLGVTTYEMSELARSDREGFEKFRQSQVAAGLNELA